MDGPHLRTLRRALQIVENKKERLAVALSVSPGELEEFLSGKPLPDQVFLDALDIVAAGEKDIAGRPRRSVG